MKIEIGSGATALTKISAAVGAILRPNENGFVPNVTSIATDSREVTEGTLFLAIRGERVDGNDYCEKALEGGASAVLCERPPKMGAAIVTDDTVLALGRLADAVKREHPCRTVAVTGSVGKTTTKDLIFEVLSKQHKTHASKGNFNSNIGLPMSMLAMPPDSERAVFELGMSALLEIDYLSRLVRPDVGVITNIGTSHMESLGSRENIAKAKLELLNGMKAGTTLLLNGDEPLLRVAKAEILARGIRPLYLSVENNEKITEDADVVAENVRQEIGQTIFDLHFGETIYRDLSVNVMGLHIVYAAAFAASVGFLEGVSEEAVRAGLLAFRSAPMRQSVETLSGVTLIEDCYNASPESMRAALDVAGTIAQKQGSGRLFALFGDMRELGETSDALHESIGRYAARTGVESLFAFGELSSHYLADGALNGGIPQDHIRRWESADAPDEIAETVLPILRKGDVLLIKASRALRAERIAEHIRVGLAGRT